MRNKFVFISYSSENTTEAQYLYDFLTEKSIPCWMAKCSLRAGSDYPTQILEAIRNCSAFVLLASKHTNHSGHVSNEVACAFDSNKPLIAFKIDDEPFTDELLYYLKRKHWIDAHLNIENGLNELYHTLQEKTPLVEEVVKTVKPIVTYKESPLITDPRDVIKLLKDLLHKFPYSLSKKISNENDYEEFKNLAQKMFSDIITLKNRGKVIDESIDYVDFAVEKLSNDNNVIMQVLGLPGNAKNMLMQLVFYKMLTTFEKGESNFLPIYISVGYYEKLTFGKNYSSEDIKKILLNDIEFYVNFIHNNLNIQPIIFVEGIRKHSVSKQPIEFILYKIFEPIGRYNRMTSIDTGLITNHLRLKKVIPISGDLRDGYIFQVDPIKIEEKAKVLNMIRCVVQMYNYSIDEERLYQSLLKFKYTTVDIFTIRLVAKDGFFDYAASSINIPDMYEKMALSEYLDEDSLYIASKKIFQYVFFENNRETELGNEEINPWILPNKHQSYLEYMIAYYFVHSIENYKSIKDYSFFRIMLTSNTNRFVVAMLKNNYDLQLKFYEFINEQYIVFDPRQKSNAAYWLGRLSYNKSISNMSLSFLTSQFTKLKGLVKTNNKTTQENLDNHFIFRSICNGMLLHGQANILDEYLCIVITNDIANAMNRGATVEYYSNEYQMGAFDEYYLDTNLNRGELAMIMLCKRIEQSLKSNKGRFVEHNLVNFLTLLQARIQTKVSKLNYDVTHYVKKSLEYLNEYKYQPQNVSSGKILYYFEGVKEDLEQYLQLGPFDVGPMIYNKCKLMKYVKRNHWVKHSIEDPESVSEHSMSSWLLAMLFLPEELLIEGYNKKEILDMLLIHDMSQTAQDFIENESLITQDLDMKQENSIMRKLLLKGTYPDIANLTYFYNIWTGYYKNVNINAKIARDINLLQSIYTFCEYYISSPEKFTDKDINEWMSKKINLVTEIGYELYQRMIINNWDFKTIVDQYEK